MMSSTGARQPLQCIRRLSPPTTTTTRIPGTKKSGVAAVFCNHPGTGESPVVDRFDQKLTWPVRVTVRGGP